MIKNQVSTAYLVFSECDQHQVSTAYLAFSDHDQHQESTAYLVFSDCDQHKVSTAYLAFSDHDQHQVSTALLSVTMINMCQQLTLLSVTVINTRCQLITSLSLTVIQWVLWIMAWLTVCRHRNKHSTDTSTVHNLPWCAVTVETRLVSPPWCWHWSTQSPHAWSLASTRSHSRHSYGTSRCTNPSSDQLSGSSEPLQQHHTAFSANSHGCVRHETYFTVIANGAWCIRDMLDGAWCIRDILDGHIREYLMQ